MSRGPSSQGPTSTYGGQQEAEIETEVFLADGSQWAATARGVTCRATGLLQPAKTVLTKSAALASLEDELDQLEKIEFTDRWRLRIPFVDSHHSRLFEICEDLRLCLKYDPSSETLDDLFKALVDYADYHFACEEKMFETFDYPQGPSHAASHAAFGTKVANWMTALKSDPDPVSVGRRVMSFLTKWLIAHIDHEDRAYADYLQDKGYDLRYVTPDGIMDEEDEEDGDAGNRAETVRSGDAGDGRAGRSCVWVLIGAVIAILSVVAIAVAVALPLIGAKSTVSDTADDVCAGLNELHAARSTLEARHVTSLVETALAATGMAASAVPRNPIGNQSILMWPLAVSSTSASMSVTVSLSANTSAGSVTISDVTVGVGIAAVFPALIAVFLCLSLVAAVCGIRYGVSLATSDVTGGDAEGASLLTRSMADSSSVAPSTIIRAVHPVPFIRQRVLTGAPVVSVPYARLTFLFVDVVGFTSMSRDMRAKHLVGMLSYIFGCMDLLATSNSITRVKTIGDAYMAIAGLASSSSSASTGGGGGGGSGDDGGESDAKQLLNGLMFGLKVCNLFTPGWTHRPSAHKDLAGYSDRFHVLRVRTGLSIGPAVLGCVGRGSSTDAWGATVNLASRMESTGSPGKLHCSPQVFDQWVNFCRAAEAANQTIPRLYFEQLHGVFVKGFGSLATYFCYLGEHVEMFTRDELSVLHVTKVRRDSLTGSVGFGLAPPSSLAAGIARRRSSAVQSSAGQSAVSDGWVPTAPECRDRDPRTSKERLESATDGKATTPTSATRKTHGGIMVEDLTTPTSPMTGPSAFTQAISGAVLGASCAPPGTTASAFANAGASRRVRLPE